VRRLVRIAVLTGAGREGLLRRELKAARRAKIPFRRIQETILQTYLFAGFPRAINGFWVLEEVFGGGVPPAPVEGRRPGWRARGERLCRRIYGPDYPALMVRMKRFHPDLAEWILAEGYGKVLGRRFLKASERELIVIGLLTAGAVWRQMPSHLRGALNVGARRAGIDAVFRALKGIVPRLRIERARKIAREVLKDVRV
jgi:4-carboxymuconolactone decarboxylase